MWEWLETWFDTERFVPRWQGGNWPAWLGWLHVVAGLAIFACYVAIPIVLAGLLLRRRDLPFPRVFGLFAAFIFTCGTVHAIEALVFWQPVYVVSGVVKGMTALVSIAAVAAVVPTMRAVLRLPGFQHDTARLATIVANSVDAILAKDLDGNVQSWNAAAERLYGYRADEMLGQPILRIVPPDRHDEVRAITARVRTGQSFGPIETERLTKSGERVAVSLTVAPVLDQAGRIIGVSSIARDVREQKEYERALQTTAVRLQRANRRLRELADRDPLTGLLNRRGFEAVLAAETERSRRQGTRAAAILIDCDDFKGVNERHGHDVGDQVLREIGDRIDDAARETDRVARIGGDEFLVLATDLRVPEALQVAERIRRAVVDAPIRTSAGALHVGVSCGVEAIDAEHATLEDLLGEGSMSLRAAKAQGKNTVVTRNGDAADLPPLGELRAAVQAIVDLGTGAPVGHEFLVRGPSGPFAAPRDLFGAHRARGSLAEADLASLERCVAAATHLGPAARVPFSVFPPTLAEVGPGPVLQRLRRGPATMPTWLEIDESELVGTPAALVDALRALRASGCRIAIDDVSFGRSSLEALIVLEPDALKVDRRLVRRCPDDAGARRHLQRLLQVGRALGAEVVAEGVERPAERDVLRDLGVRLAQGFLFGAPRDVDELPRTDAR